MSGIVGTPRAIKLLNKDIIQDIIKVNGPITKPEIAKITNLSLVTVNKTVETLLQENKVKVSGVNQSTGGRRAQFFEINEELNYIVGLCYHKDVYLGAIANSIGDIIYRQEFPVRVDTYDEVMEDTYFAIDTLIEKCNGHVISAIGIGVPGVINEGIVTNIPNIPSWENINIEKIIEEKYQMTVLLENDINLATIGLYYNDYKDEVDNLALIYLEQGIGSGLILNRELFKGSTNFAGELSYIPVGNQIMIDGKKTKYKGNFENKIALINEYLETCTEDKKDEMNEMLLKTIADGLMSIICVINPDIIALKLEKLTDEGIKKIEELIEALIHTDNIPKIIKLNDLRKYSIHGVMNMCIRETMPIYQLTNRKRG